MTLKKYGTGKQGSYDYKVIRLPFQIKDIYKVYIGKQGCACGCGGNYYEGPKSEDFNELSATEKKKHLRMIKFAYNRIKKLRKQNGIQVIGNYIYSWEGETRAVRIYLHD